MSSVKKYLFDDYAYKVNQALKEVKQKEIFEKIKEKCNFCKVYNKEKDNFENNFSGSLN